jgi:hypothetical protein
MTAESDKHDTLSIFSGNSGNDYCRKCGEKLFCLLGMFSQPVKREFKEYITECPRCGAEFSVYIMRESYHNNH